MEEGDALTAAYFPVALHPIPVHEIRMTVGRY